MSALRRCGLMLFLALFYGLSWLALWTISFYLNDNGQQAALLLPQGLRLALLILLTRRYWPVLIGVETALLFRGQRAPMILLFSLGLFLSVTAIWLVPIHHYALLAVNFFSIGFFVFGPQMIIGLAATEYAHKEAAGTATGFLGLFAYLGAALAGWPLAQWMQFYGWSGFFALLTLAAACVGLLLMPLMMAGTSRSQMHPSRGPNASGPP